MAPWLFRCAGLMTTLVREFTLGLAARGFGPPHALAVRHQCHCGLLLVGCVNGARGGAADRFLLPLLGLCVCVW